MYSLQVPHVEDTKFVVESYKVGRDLHEIIKSRHEFGFTISFLK